MQQEWYIAIEGQPFGPFKDKNIENMLKNRTLHFVDYVWSEEFGEWVRVYRAGVFNHLLPEKPDFKLDTARIKSMDIEKMVKVEATDVSKAESHIQRPAGRVLSSTTRSAPPEVVSFVADAIIHDSFKVYHGVVYGLSKNELYVACRSGYLPPSKKLQILVTSEEFNKIFTVSGKVRAISSKYPPGYAVLIDEMPSEFKKITG